MVILRKIPTSPLFARKRPWKRVWGRLAVSILPRGDTPSFIGHTERKKGIWG